MKLSRTVVYALRAALEIASSESPAPVPCSRLAAEGNMPERFLLQILRTLVTADILVSTRGVEGGYRLANSPSDITLLSIMEAIEGPYGKPPVLGEGFPPTAQFKLLDVLARADKSLKETLGSISLADMIASKSSAPTGSATSASTS